MKPLILVAFLAAVALARPSFSAENLLVGVWKVVAADVIHLDGTREEDYGNAPLGIAIFTESGHYAVEIYKSERLKFASNDKFKGTPEEYRDASLAMSCHYGTYSVDRERKAVTLQIESSSYPNIVGSTRVSAFELVGDELTWRVPPRPDGSVPVTTFKRIP